jgi:hypothetical protein
MATRRTEGESEPRLLTVAAQSRWASCKGSSTCSMSPAIAASAAVGSALRWSSSSREVAASKIQAYSEPLWLTAVWSTGPLSCTPPRRPGAPRQRRASKRTPSPGSACHVLSGDNGTRPGRMSSMFAPAIFVWHVCPDWARLPHPRVQPRIAMSGMSRGSRKHYRGQRRRESDNRATRRPQFLILLARSSIGQNQFVVYFVDEAFVLPGLFG